ncbi:MAG: 4-hydroxy-3-polyprenylbenzoate decarboxylase [Gammaproteobacteria bacterium]|jgi:4-hydroxy-3-polyprenylbenzoate decarboxylase
MSTATVALAITGASGAAYGLRLLETLLAQHIRVHLVISNPGRIVIAEETDLRLPSKPQEICTIFNSRFNARLGDLQVYGREDWFAPMASGSNPPDAMVICPCTTGTLAEIAAGTSRGLIERAADVALKEKRRLILVVRETPFSTIHLQNMLRLAEAGAVIMPANPGFYQRPESIEEIVDYMVARILDHLHVEHDLMVRWGANRLP